MIANKQSWSGAAARHATQSGSDGIIRCETEEYLPNKEVLNYHQGAAVEDIQPTHRREETSHALQPPFEGGGWAGVDRSSGGIGGLKEGQDAGEVELKPQVEGGRVIHACMGRTRQHLCVWAEGW